jgi:hypothetical protein
MGSRRETGLRCAAIVIAAPTSCDDGLRRQALIIPNSDLVENARVISHARNLGRTLLDFQRYDSGHRTHAGLDGRPPEPSPDVGNARTAVRIAGSGTVVGWITPRWRRDVTVANLLMVFAAELEIRHSEVGNVIRECHPHSGPARPDQTGIRVGASPAAQTYIPPNG